MSASTVSDLNQRIYQQIEQWRQQPLVGDFPYVFLDGIWLKRSWGGEVKKVSVLVAIGVSQSGYRQILAVSEGAKEDREGRQGELDGVPARLEGAWPEGGAVIRLRQVPGPGREPGRLLSRAQVAALRGPLLSQRVDGGAQRQGEGGGDDAEGHHAQKDAAAAAEKARQVVEKLHAMKLAKAADIVANGIGETLSYYHLPPEHWRCLRTNNPLERLMREIRRRTRVVGAFPDGNSALMLVAARLRHVASTRWGSKRCLQMNRLAEVVAIA